MMNRSRVSARKVSFGEGSDFGNATAMIEACQLELTRAGYHCEARTISGLEVFSHSDAEMAIATLAQIRVRDEAIQSALWYTRGMLSELTEPTALAS